MYGRRESTPKCRTRNSISSPPPLDARRRLSGALAMLRGKRLDNPSKKHDNIRL
jgi:hypothetical protein